MAEDRKEERPALIVEHLRLWIKSGGDFAKILKDVSFQVMPGEKLGIVGESGAGKSMTMCCLTGLLPARNVRMDGSIRYLESDGSYRDILELPGKERQPYCAKKISMIPQDSMNALNPFERVEKQWQETVSLHHPELSRRQIREHILCRLEEFGISGGNGIMRKYPHQLSGGMRQRIAIAMALEAETKILAADEPTTSLDSVNQRRIVEFIRDICRRKNLSLLYITHNPGIVQELCTNMIVMNSGKVVEQGWENCSGRSI